jgi:hypothetical protein
MYNQAYCTIEGMPKQAKNRVNQGRFCRIQLYKELPVEMHREIDIMIVSESISPSRREVNV